jgi:putative ABC transport system permease protein
MATAFPVKEENHQNAISFIEYQPRVSEQHLLAEEDVHKIVARNHGFDASDDNAFDGWDTIQESKMVGTIFDVMNMFLGAVGSKLSSGGENQ